MFLALKGTHALLILPMRIENYETNQNFKSDWTDDDYFNQISLDNTEEIDEVLRASDLNDLLLKKDIDLAADDY